MTDKIKLLEQVQFFKHLDKSKLALIAEKCTEKEYPKNTIIINRYEEGDTLFIMESGQAKAVLTGKSGREIVLSYFKSGDIFGELSLFDRQPRSADVIAMKDTMALTLSRSDFKSITANNPEILFSIIAEFCLRMRHADEIIENLALMDVFGRVIRHLNAIITRSGRIVGEWCEIYNAPTQQEIANSVGTSRETVSRLFSEYRKRGVLRTSGKKLMMKRSALLEISESEE